MKLDNATLGHTIARYRRFADMKASEVAGKIGMKTATYSKYERGETAITIEFLQKVATAINIDPMQLLQAQPMSSESSNKSLHAPQNGTNIDNQKFAGESRTNSKLNK